MFSKDESAKQSKWTHVCFKSIFLYFLTNRRKPEPIQVSKHTGSVFASVSVKTAVSVHHSSSSVGGRARLWGHSHGHGRCPALWCFHPFLEQVYTHWNQCRKHGQRTERYPGRIPITFHVFLNYFSLSVFKFFYQVKLRAHPVIWSCPPFQARPTRYVDTHTYANLFSDFKKWHVCSMIFGKYRKA